MSRGRIVVVGGGAAGFFGAIACAEADPAGEVVLLEKSPELLAKVTISGGGRCNVTNHCFDVRRLVDNYPRGGKELIGPFHRWQPRDTVAWFESRGVALKTEPDARMFPMTDSSATIVKCLVDSARRAGVKIVTSCGLRSIRLRAGGGFDLDLSTGEAMDCGRLLLASGGNKNTAGYRLASSAGHAIEPPVPSLFTFNITDPRLDGLQGISMPGAQVTAPALRLTQKGPVLITHWGLSGPAILKLSAWGARAFADCDYAFDVVVNWLGVPFDMAETKVEEERKRVPARRVLGASVFDVPTRLWDVLASHAGIEATIAWGQLSREKMRNLVRELTASSFRVTGKSMFKEEFVTCGGVRLSEVDFRTMESRLCPGLHFAGEVLDIDAVTGGFNFQAAWTTGWIAGRAMAGAA